MAVRINEFRFSFFILFILLFIETKHLVKGGEQEQLTILDFKLKDQKVDTSYKYDLDDDTILKNDLDVDQNVSNELKESKNENSKMSTDNEVTEDPLNTLITIGRTPIQLLHAILTGKETSKHAKEISDIIGQNLKKIVKKFFKIANDALDNLNTINNAGLVSAIVQLASFMSRMHSAFQTYTNPNEWQQTLSVLKANLPDNLNIRLPLNLRSPNAHHEDFFDDYL